MFITNKNMYSLLPNKKNTVVKKISKDLIENSERYGLAKSDRRLFYVLLASPLPN